MSQPNLNVNKTLIYVKHQYKNKINRIQSNNLKRKIHIHFYK